MSKNNELDLHPSVDDSGELDDFEINVPYHLYTGRIEPANYTLQNVPSYQGNPLIEALPPIFEDQKAVLQALRQQPDDDINYLRYLSAGERIHCVHDLEDQLFQPLPHHLSMQIKIDCMLRRGYVMRNPIHPGFYPRLKQEVASLSQPSARMRRPRRPKAHGFNLIGPSGIGKSYSLETLLDLYPQRIDHTVYNGRRFTQRQLVWLKMDCPFDGSLKALPLNFFTAADAVLGTNYSTIYAKSSRTSIDDLLRSMANVAALHFLGALAVDEIQVLRAMRSENSAHMLNFFVNLVNTIGVPVLLVGTSRARRLFEGDPRQARRGTGQGAEVWELMSFDRNWSLFLKALFKFQYVAHPVNLSDELSAAFFDETQGITDLVVKLYVQSQIRAMTTGIEMVTPEIVRSVALDSFQMLRPVIMALRQGDKRALAEFEDIYPIWRKEYAESTLRQQIDVSPPPNISQPATEQLPREDATDECNQSTPAIPADPETSNSARSAARRTKPSKSTQVVAESLMGIIEHGKKQQITPYHALQQAGYIFSFEDYTKQEGE